jgi:hypothetical protein
VKVDDKESTSVEPKHSEIKFDDKKIHTESKKPEIDCLSRN